MGQGVCASRLRDAMRPVGGSLAASDPGVQSRLQTGPSEGSGNTPPGGHRDRFGGQRRAVTPVTRLTRASRAAAGVRLRRLAPLA